MYRVENIYYIAITLWGCDLLTNKCFQLRKNKQILSNRNAQFWIQWFHEFSEVVEVVEGLLLLAGADSENFFIACNQTLMLSLDQIIFEERQKTVHSDWYHLSWWIFIWNIKTKDL